jgi:hypothetical protein
MARPAKPWFWKARKIWCVNHKGKRILLGPDRDEAFRQYHAIMAKPDEERQPLQWGAVAAILDDFLTWTEENRAAKTFTRYRDFLQTADGRNRSTGIRGTAGIRPGCPVPRPPDRLL